MALSAVPAHDRICYEETLHSRGAGIHLLACTGGLGATVKATVPLQAGAIVTIIVASHLDQNQFTPHVATCTMRLPITWLKPPAGRARGPVCWGAALLGAGRLTGMAWHTMLWAAIMVYCSDKPKSIQMLQQLQSSNQIDTDTGDFEAACTMVKELEANVS